MTLVCPQVLGGLLAGAALTLSGAANAVTPVDVIDDRKARNTGFDLIYGANTRVLSCPLVRRGLQGLLNVHAAVLCLVQRPVTWTCLRTCAMA